MAKQEERTGFNVGTLKIEGVCNWAIEMSDDDKFVAEIQKKNAELRFKHKVFNPPWEIRRIGEGKPPSLKPSRN